MLHAVDLRQKLRDQIEAVGGRHDEPRLYGGAPGDPGLAGGPGSISWEINGDLASVAAAGMAAILMEVLHPSVMAGVFEQSTYRDPAAAPGAEHARLRAAHDLRQHRGGDRGRSSGSRRSTAGSTAPAPTACRTAPSIPS